MHSDTIADIYLPNTPATFPNSALQIYVVPALKTKSLMSLGQLCDAGCTVHLTSTTLNVLYKGTCILQGTRTQESRLWHVQLERAPEPPVIPPTTLQETVEHTAYLAAGGSTPAHLVAFHHASLGAPALTTLEKALRLNYVTGFPGLTVDNLRKHPPISSIPMLKGHLDQSRKNQRSTTNIGATATIIPFNDTEGPMIHTQQDDSADAHQHDPDHFPSSEPENERTHFCYAAVYEPTGTIYTDLTGKFVAPSTTGNNYLFVLYDYDSNCILCEPIKNRTKTSILNAFQRLHTQLVRAGVRPRLQRLDNECSDILKEYMIQQNIDYQLVPPHVHRRNAAERAIRTFKNHFVATLCSTDPAFPLYLWDRLLPQTMLTLNLLRGSRMNPKLSAYAQIFGPFDYNRTPLAPAGTRAIIHDKPSNRESWAAHGLDGWYLGPALESYRCYLCWITETRRERICDTVAFLPLHVTLPVATANDMILASLRDIIVALKMPAQNLELTPPTITNTNRTALMQLQLLLDPPTNAPREPGPAPLPEHTPPLRLQAPDGLAVRTAPSLRVMLPLNNAPSTPTGSPSGPALRVMKTPTLNNSPTTPKRSNLTTGKQTALIEDDHETSLPLVPIIMFPHPTSSPTVPLTPSNPVEDVDPTATFQLRTGPRARKARRASHRAPLPVTGTSPLRTETTGTTVRHKHRTRTSTGAITKHAANTASPTNAQFPDEYALHGNAFNPDTGKLAEYKELSQSSDGPIWIESACEEIGRLFQGYKTIRGTNTCFFIRKREVPRGKRPTYLRIVCAHRPEKDNPFRLWDQLSYC